MIAELTRHCIGAWLETPRTFPSSLRSYAPREREANKAALETFFRNVRSRRPPASVREADRLLLRHQVRAGLGRILWDDPPSEMDHFMDACEDVGRTFIRTATSFDHDVAAEDVFQALRNQWVFNSIQQLLAHPVSMTESSFAYSMLYPYTDNCVDHPGIAHSDKMRFLRWLASRLHGKTVSADGPHTDPVHRLIGMVERQYPRTEFPAVYGSLLAIHYAQEKSLRLQRDCRGIAEEALLGLTVEKGGASVLADGTLVWGSLAPGQAEAVFAYGAMLQFVDDLQDVNEDSTVGHSGPFVRALAQGTLDGITNQLFHYIAWCSSVLRTLSGGATSVLCGTIAESCNILVLESIARHGEHYSPAYRAHCERYMPLPAEFFGSLKDILTGIASGIRFTEDQPHRRASNDG